MPSPADRTRRGRTPVVIVVAALVAALGACDGSGDDARPVVEVFGPLVDQEGAELAAVLRDVSADAPVQLRYIGVSSFNEQLDDRLARGDVPGVALVPQPGLLDALSARGILQPLPAEVADALDDDFPDRLVELVERSGAPSAVPVTVDVKGLVWYRPDELTARGLAVPATLDELAELSETVRTSNDGTSPWCVTMEAGASTGWVGTDWVEDYVLRRLGADGYRRWVDGELLFDGPEITVIFEELDALLRRPGAIEGGSRAVLSVPWERTAALLLDSDAPCLMAHQGDFLRRQFPDATPIGPAGTVDFFQFPAATSTAAAPLIVGGLLAVGLDDAPEVADGLAILAGADIAERLVRTDQFLSPRVGAADVADPTAARLLDLVAQADEVQFDGSDLMPPNVGTGTFWSGMRRFFAGEDLASVLPAIQDGWDRTDAPG